MTDDAERDLAPEEPLDISDSRRDGAHRNNEDLIQVIKDYADKLAADQATRGPSGTRSGVCCSPGRGCERKISPTIQAAPGSIR